MKRIVFDEDIQPMKEVILSSDGDLSLYRVPAEVADNLIFPVIFRQRKTLVLRKTI